MFPGPEEPVRVIVQLRDEPLAIYIRRTFAAPRPLTASQAAAARQYAETLAARRRQFLAQIQQQGIVVKVNREFGYLINGAALSIKMHDWKRLAQIPQVKAVYPDYEVRATLNESVPLIGAPALWAMTDAQGKPVTGEGARVAIIDTGVDYAHPDLGGCLGPSCKVVSGYDFVNQDSDPLDDHGHGTHVAGIVAARGALKGVAPDVKLLAYKVLDANGAGKDSDVIAALERAADPDGDPATDDGAHVVNLSLGGDGNPDDPVCQAVDNAVELGLVVVAAAGNYGPDYHTLTSPGVARKAITVAASNKNDELASFGSCGPILGFETVVKPDITAPGVRIYSTGLASSYRYLDGTSMAAPHVAGAAALLRQLHPIWTPETIKANLMNTAKDLGRGVYEQGAGRVQLAKAATAPLVAAPGNLGFGAPHISGATTQRLSLMNVSTTTVTAAVAISTTLWADSELALVTPAAPVNYAQLSSSRVALAPGATQVITVSVHLPNDAAEGYYAGRVLVQGADFALTVPFTFIALSRVTVHILDENGIEVTEPEMHASRTYGRVYLVRMPGTDVRRVSGLNNQPPSIFYVPAGTYDVHGFARFWINDSVLGEAAAPPKPLVLASTFTIGRSAALDVYLNAATARRFTLDATGFDGAPLFVARWRALFRYQNGGQEYTAGLNVGYAQFKDTHLRAPLPSSFDLYVSDTLAHTSFTLASDMYGYSPRLRQFRDLNSARWYEGGDGLAGFNLTQNADQVYWFAWQYPRIDASTPTIFRYTRDQVSRNHIRYDFSGVLDGSSSYWGSFASGGDLLFYLPSDSITLILPLSAGLERDVYVKGSFAYRYLTDGVAGNRFVEKEFYTRDWTRAYTTTQAPDLRLIKGWDAQPLPRRDETYTFGAGPLYPAATFDNAAATIRLIHPVFGSSRGLKAYWGDDPYLTVYRGDTQIYTATLQESWWSPSPMRQIPAGGGSDYRVLITATSRAHVSYANTIEAGFTLPAADMNPPRVIALEMPQRFAPGQPLPVALTVTDAESGVGDVWMYYSADEDGSWTPLTMERAGSRYTTTIVPGDARAVTLAFGVTDAAGNYLRFVTRGAAIRETPVTLDLSVFPTTIPLSAMPVSLRISGALRQSNGQPLAPVGLPIAIYLNDQFAGYVRDVARLPDGTFQNGTIAFDWAFIPTDFLSRAGPAQLKFVFDLGTYARQERVLPLQVGARTAPYFLPFVSK